jgi:hypothetical protein
MSFTNDSKFTSALKIHTSQLSGSNVGCNQWAQLAIGEHTKGQCTWWCLQIANNIMSSINEWGKPACSYRRTGWVWENRLKFQDFRKITKGIDKLYPNSIYKIRKMSTCNRLGLETLGYRLIMLTNLPGRCLYHIVQLSYHISTDHFLHSCWKQPKGIVLNLARALSWSCYVAVGASWPRHLAGGVHGQQFTGCILKKHVQAYSPIFCAASIFGICYGWF